MMLLIDINDSTLHKLDEITTSIHATSRNTTINFLIDYYFEEVLD